MSSRPSLILIPSQLCTGAVWQPQIADLSDIADIEVVDHTQGDSIDSIAGSILASAPPRFSLGAHGMGGFVAFEIMRQAPQRVIRLALLNTLAQPDGPDQLARRHGYAELVKAGKFDQIVEERIPILFHPERQQDEDFLRTTRTMAHETGAAAFIRQQIAIMGRPDSRPSLRAISCPTLVIASDQDAIAKIEDAQLIADRIPGARLEIIKDCGHLSTLEKPEAVTALLRGWLAADLA